MIIDTHCHIDLYPNPNAVIDELEKNGIITIGMTNLPSHFGHGYPHTRNYKKVRLALGLHPLNAWSHSKEFPLFEKYLDFTSYIGEVGLDFSKQGIETKNIQITSFKKVLEAVSNKKKILSIHSRGAEKEVLQLLIEYKIENAIFHWYSGNLKLIDEIINSGYFFSINTAMISTIKGEKIINRIPKEFILTETDGPFISYKNRLVKGMDINVIIDYLNSHFQTEKMEEQIAHNFRRLINKIKS